MAEEIERVGGTNFFFQFQTMRETFIRSKYVREEKESFNPLKGCVSSRGATFLGGIS